MLPFETVAEQLLYGASCRWSTDDAQTVDVQAWQYKIGKKSTNYAVFPLTLCCRA